MLLPSHWLPVKIHQQACPFGMFWCPLIRIWETYHPAHKIRCTNIANFGHSEKPEHLSGSVPVGHHTLPQIFPLLNNVHTENQWIQPKGQTFPASRATQKWSGRSTSKYPPHKMWRKKKRTEKCHGKKKKKHVIKFDNRKMSNTHLWSSMVLITALAPKGGWHRIHLQSAKSWRLIQERFENHNIKATSGKKNSHDNCTNAT